MKIICALVFVAIFVIHEINAESSKCGLIPYNTATFTCCNNVLSLGAKLSCCGSIAYNQKYSTCCNGILQLKPDLSCCGYIGYNNSLSQCCSPGILGKNCCGNVAYDGAVRKCCSPNFVGKIFSFQWNCASLNIIPLVFLTIFKARNAA